MDIISKVIQINKARELSHSPQHSSCHLLHVARVCSEADFQSRGRGAAKKKDAIERKFGFGARTLG